MQRRFRSLLALLLLFPFTPPAQAAVFSRSDAGNSRLVARSLGAPLGASSVAPGVSVPDRVSLMAVDADGIRAFRANGGGRFALPAADGSTLELDLAPYDILGPGESVSTSDEQGRHGRAADVTLYRGRVNREPASWAVIAMGSAGVFGTLEHAGIRYNLSPAENVPAPIAGTQPVLPVHALSPESSRPENASPFRCGIDDTNERALTTPLLSPGGGAAEARPSGSTAASLVTPRTTWKIAVDCDYEVYHLKFADNLTAEASYVLAVLGTVNLIYERELQATLTFPYVNLWTTAADPYSASTTSAQLTQMEGYWTASNAAVVRSAAFLMSGRPLGGGISNIGALCSPTTAFALAAMDFVYTYPTATSTWDVAVTAHELGHVFGSYHTHSCAWASQGFVPAGTTLDSCFVAEGCTIPYTTHLPPDKGTLMSYCHIAYGVANGIRLNFHPVCVQRMRSVMSAASCNALADPQPPQNPATAPLAAGVRVSWTASTSPGVLGYEVFRSHDALDPHATRAGFTPALQWDDAGFGTYSYRVRAVRTADTSSWSSEVLGTSPCGMVAGAALTAGVTPVTGLSADLNADGREDAIVLRKGDNTLGLLFGQGTGAVGNGTFGAVASAPSAVGPACIAIGDVTGDGIADLLIGAQTDNTLRMQKGNGAAGVPDGTFTLANGLGTLPGKPRCVILADVDEDGLDDVLACADGMVVKKRGQGVNGVPNGTFGAIQSTPVFMTTYDLVAHDFDADGVLDLAVTGDGGLKTQAGGGLNGRGDGTFALPATYAAGASPGRLAVADLNADGADDILVCDRGDSLVRVFLGHRTAAGPDGTFAPGVAYGAGASPGAIAIVDWDHDGLSDVVVGNDTAPGTVSVLTSRGDGTLLPRFFVPTGGDSCAALITADFDEDGSLDVLALNRSTGTYTRITTGCPGTLSNAVTLLTPNGGETWAVQDERTVTWVKGAGVLSVDVELSKDSGVHWRTIARALTGTSWKWSVTGPTGVHDRLRVVAHGMPQSTAASNADFTVVPASSLGVDDGPPRLALIGAWPNPARRELTVSFSLPAGERGRLELVDPLGRRVAGLDLEGGASGARQVELFGPQAPPPGVYLVRLMSGAALRLAKVVVVR